MAHDRGCEISEIQPHTVTIEQKERNSILLVQQRVGMKVGDEQGAISIGNEGLGRGAHIWALIARWRAIQGACNDIYYVPHGSNRRMSML
jgi:hypothetical protein